MLHRHVLVCAIFILHSRRIVCTPPPLPPLPPLPAPSPPPRWVGGWQVNITGPCQHTTDGSCIASPNYPLRYGAGVQQAQTCQITGVPRLPLVVRTFDTKRNYDFITINGDMYSGRDGPAGVVPLNGKIFWTAYPYKDGIGWEMCWSDQPAPPLPPRPPPSPPQAPSPPLPPSPPSSLRQPVIAILSGGVIVLAVLSVCLLQKIYEYHRRSGSSL